MEVTEIFFVSKFRCSGADLNTLGDKYGAEHVAALLDEVVNGKWDRNISAVLEEGNAFSIFEKLKARVLFSALNDTVPEDMDPDDHFKLTKIGRDMWLSYRNLDAGTLEIVKKVAEDLDINLSDKSFAEIASQYD